MTTAHIKSSDGHYLAIVILAQLTGTRASFRTHAPAHGCARTERKVLRPLSGHVHTPDIRTEAREGTRPAQRLESAGDATTVAGREASP